MEKQIVTFLAGGILFGIDVRMVREVCKYAMVTPLPNVPDYFYGLTNLHGKIHTMLDLCNILRIAPLKNSDSCTLLVLKTDSDLRMSGIAEEYDFHLGNDHVALLIDSLGDVLDISDEGINQFDTLPSQEKELLKGAVRFNNGIAFVLDIKKLFDRIMTDSKIHILT